MSDVPIEITRLVKSDGPLTKRIHLDPQGALANDSGDCRMSQGTMSRQPLPDLRAFAALIETTPRNTAYALGTMRPGLPDSLKLVTKQDPRAGAPGFATRTQGTFVYEAARPALVLCDFDTKGMLLDVKRRLLEMDGFRGGLAAVCHGLAAAGRVHRRSTSANIVNGTTGETYQSHGQHVFVLVRDGSDAKRFLYTLHDRCWLAGLGWYIVGAAGQLLERSIIDRAVCAPERLVFEANPDLGPPLRQERRAAVVHDGPPLDTVTACHNLKKSEKAELDARKAAAAHPLGEERKKARKAFVDVHVERAVARGMDRDKARTMAERWGEGVLRPGAMLVFDDRDLGEVDVAAILADPDRFDGATLADPIEGVGYGRNCAIVQIRSDEVQIYSFAHGGAIYKLQHDFASVEAAILAGAETDAVDILCRYGFRADLDKAEKKQLAKLAGERAGVGQRIAESMLADAAAARRKKAAQAVREENAAISTRMRIDEIMPDAEIGPVMELLDDILTAISANEPPMRDVEGLPVEVQCRETPGLHELTPRGANDEEEEKSRLPSPKNFLLTGHDRESLEILIGDYIAFIRKTADGERSVAPPAKVINHFMKYRRSHMPRVYAVQTMPLVLADGTLLARNGLDRDRRAVFRIDPALLPFVPKIEDCTERDVNEAFEFLANEWLCDVETNLEGKCVLIALALTIIERLVLPARPLFFVTAGLRGGGKTTTLMMIALAALGIKAAAAAWSSDPNERKKALFAYLLEALPFLVWDNIPRGTMIACPNLERAATSETYSDRILGETRTPIAPSNTVHAFTGNNIGPKSDQASRSLEVRIMTDRPDPENRAFKHSDPIGWTRDHRGQILRALYTIMLGNPQLKPGERGPDETRFKEWWHIIGSAVENAAYCMSEKLCRPISFKVMFERIEAKDEDASERANIIQTLYTINGRSNFTAISLHEHLAKSAREAEIGIAEAPGTAELRRFCTARLAKTPSPKSISHNLQAIVDAPVEVVSGTVILKSEIDTHAKQRLFYVDLPKKREPQ